MSYNTRSEAMPGAKVTPPARFGLVSGKKLEGALIFVMHALACILILLSILGTFYGMRGVNAPLEDPVQIVIDLWAAPSLLLAALIVQGLLSLVQWGGRQIAAYDQRWWIGYLGALALSLWWNWQAFGEPMIGLGVPWLIAIGIVLAGDILPELALVRQ